MAINRGSFDKLETLRFNFPIVELGDYAEVREHGITFVFTDVGWLPGSPASEASTFIELLDVPQSYTGQANKIVAVNPAGTGLEFIEGSGVSAFTELSDVPNNYVGAGGKSVFVKPDASGLEFKDAGGGTVDSVFGRNAAVVAQAGDYDASQVDNDSSVPGTTVKDALETLNSGSFISTTIYVDKNRIDVYVPTGTIDKPYKSITAAYASIIDESDSKKYVVDVIGGGDYLEQITLRSYIGIRSTNSLCTIQNPGGIGHTIIVPTGMAAVCRLEGLVIINNSTNPSDAAVSVVTGGNVGFSRCSITGETGTGLLVNGGAIYAELSIFRGLDYSANISNNGNFNNYSCSFDGDIADVNVTGTGKFKYSSPAFKGIGVIGNGVITRYHYAVSIKNDSDVEGVTVTDALNTLLQPAIEIVTKNIYISTTGSDTAGLGTIGSPYFSIHRALKAIKNNVLGVEIAIIAMDGVYDYSALGDIFIDKKITKGPTFIGKIRIKPNSSLADRFTVLDNGTFDNNVDTESNIHTCTGKTWTPNAYVGKFIRVSTMNSGSLPGNGDGINYTYRIIPILRNGADWIETGYSNNAFYNNFGAFDIVEHKVVFNLGANSFYISDDSLGGMLFNSIQIITTGNIMIQQGTTEFVVNPAFQLIAYNLSLIANYIFCRCTAISVSYFKATNRMSLGWMQCNVLDTSYNFNYGKIELNDFSASCVFINNAVTAIGPLVYVIGKNNYASMSGLVKFINTAIAIQATCDFGLSCKVTIETVNFLMVLYPDNIRITNPTGLFIMNSEPAIGRLTYDGTLEATYYNDLNKSYIATCLAPTVIDVTAASQLTNDSSVAGTKIKDALERLTVVNLPSSAFSGLGKITVSDTSPGSPSVGDLWIDIT